jgi:hypothetical protein
MLAADFFWCQFAHEAQLPADLAALAQPTIDHLAWRFSQVRSTNTYINNSVAVHSDNAKIFTTYGFTKAACKNAKLSNLCYSCELVS